MPDLLPFLTPDDFVKTSEVAWRVEQGTPDPANPLLEPDRPWDAGAVFAHGTILRDPIDGLWKIWHLAIEAGCQERRLGYLESEDGVRWTRPELDICPYPGCPKTNILLDYDSGGTCHYPSVFVRPDAPAGYPYEMFIMRSPGHPPGVGTKQIAGLALPPDADRHPHGMYRYRSKDGKRWEVVEALKLKTADSLYVYRFEDDGPYVAYHKTEIPCPPGALVPYDVGAGGVRIIVRRTSQDGSTWSDPWQLALAPDWRDPQDTQFMELGPIVQPGGLIATTTVYHNLNQSIDLQFAASRDGVTWWRPDRRPCLPNAPLGDWGGGLIWPMRNMVIDGDRLHVYYAGVEGLHGDLYGTVTRDLWIDSMREGQDLGVDLRDLKCGPQPYCRGVVHGLLSSALCRATWKAGRLWALVSAFGGVSEGVAITAPMSAGGKTLFVSAATVRDGQLRAELLDSGERPIPGFTRDDCRPFQGDTMCTAITWSGGDRCPKDKVALRFYVRRAMLYGFDLRDSSP